MNLKIKDNEFALAWYKVSLAIAIIAGVFTLIGSALLVSNYIQLKSSDPLNSPELIGLNEKLVNEPGNQEIKEQVRDLDLKLRIEYFRHREFSRLGSYLLIGSMAIFLIAIKFYEFFREKIPNPEPTTSQEDEEARTIRISRWVIIAIAIVVCGSAFALVESSGKAVFFRNAQQIVAEAKEKAKEPKNVQVAQNTEISQPLEIKVVEEQSEVQAEEVAQETEKAQPEEPPTQTPTYPTAEEIKKNWHRFRGPDGIGLVHANNIPALWDGKTGKNILWKTKLFLPGQNSPIVWGKKVFLTGATDKKREVYCFDADTGKLLWQKPV